MRNKIRSVLIISKSKEEAEVCEQALTGLKSLKVYPGITAFPTHFDAVIIFHNQMADLDITIEEQKRYSGAPIRLYIGKEKKIEENKDGCEAFTISQITEVKTYLSQKYSEIHKLMGSIFKQFDKDNSGFIDLQELKQISAELGRELDNIELEECIKDLDTNKDGKVSYDEFATWWLSGRQAYSFWMKKMLNLKLKASTTLMNLRQDIHYMLQSDSASLDNICKNSFQVNLNKFEKAGASFYTKLFFLSPEQKLEYQRIKSMYKFEMLADILTDVVLEVQVEIKPGKIEEAKQKFEDLISNKMKSFIHLIKVVTEDNKLCIGIAMAHISQAIGYSLVPYENLIKKIQDELQVDQNVEISLRLASNFTQIFDENAGPLLNEIMKGVSFDFKLNLWRKIYDVITKMAAENDGHLQEITGIFGGVSPAILLRLGAKIDITADGYVQEKLAENMLVQQFGFLNAFQYSGMLLSRFDEDLGEENEEEQEEGPFELLAILDYLCEEFIGDDVQLSFAHPYFGFKSSLTGEGLRLFFKAFDF